MSLRKLASHDLQRGRVGGAPFYGANNRIDVGSNLAMTAMLRPCKGIMRPYLLLG